MTGGTRRACTTVAGFTLLEVLIVVSIVGVLATLAAPQLTRMIHRARFRGEARALMGAVAEARGLAMQSGRTHQLQFLADRSRAQQAETGGDTTLAWRIVRLNNDGTANELSARPRAAPPYVVFLSEDLPPLAPPFDHPQHQDGRCLQFCQVQGEWRTVDITPDGALRVRNPAIPRATFSIAWIEGGATVDTLALVVIGPTGTTRIVDVP